MRRVKNLLQFIAGTHNVRFCPITFQESPVDLDHTFMILGDKISSLVVE